MVDTYCMPAIFCKRNEMGMVGHILNIQHESQRNLLLTLRMNDKEWHPRNPIALDGIRVTRYIYIYLRSVSNNMSKIKSFLWLNSIRELRCRVLKGTERARERNKINDKLLLKKSNQMVYFDFIFSL